MSAGAVPVAISPSSSVQRAREQLAAQLREVRLDAGMSAQALSAAAGWHKAKTSRIESAQQAPSEADIAVWCRACGADREVPDLVAASRAADQMYIEYRRVNRGGLRRLQEPANPLFLRTRSEAARDQVTDLAGSVRDHARSATSLGQDAAVEGDDLEALPPSA